MPEVNPPAARQTATGPGEPSPSFSRRLRRLLIGPPRDLEEQGLFHRLSLVPFLAWVGLGADGLSSSAYGPEEAYRTLGEHTYLGVALAALMATTVFVISAAYSRLIEEFPHGGGGYVVATRLLGPRTGLVSGCALLVDYVLTITVSIAAAGDALFSLCPQAQWAKVPVEVLVIAGLITLNIRGVRESVLVLAPVFLLFLATHLVLILGGVLVKVPHMAETAREVSGGFRAGWNALGAGGMLLLFVHAYSLGGGTYTGIEAVSNGLPIMREPRVRTAKRTMAYMAASLAFTATGLLLSYLLWHVEAEEHKTLNAVLVERFSSGIPGGSLFVAATLLAEGALLVVAAQAGFLDGPRVLANMALDSWVPRRFSSLSERLTTQNGILLMGGAALAALLYTGGNVRQIVVMYSINVFLTFSISLFGMARCWLARRGRDERWRRRLPLFSSAFLLCATVLSVTVLEKFREGGWLTLAVTGTLVLLCHEVRSHYRRVAQSLARLYASLEGTTSAAETPLRPLDPTQPTAVVLVASYGGLGIHTVLNVFRMFPGYFKNLVFLSVGVIDTDVLKGEEEVATLRERTTETLRRYVALAAGLGVPAAWKLAVGTDVVQEAEQLCRETAKEFPVATFFAGKVVFERESWYHRLLHNETAFAVQRRLQSSGITMVIVPAQVPGRA